MLLPTTRLATLVLAPGVLLAVWPSTATLVFAGMWCGLIAALTVVDARVSPGPADLEIHRLAPPRLSLNADNPVEWTLRNRHHRPALLRLVDDLPVEFQVTPLPEHIRLRPNSQASVTYHLRPLQRGLFELGDIHLRTQSLLGLIQRQTRLPRQDKVKAYPSVAAIKQYELAARHGRRAEMGLTVNRLARGGTEFESLRDYVPGDELGNVAWKATARRRRPITRQFQADRNQNILLLLDTGRLMTTQAGALSRLDHAINACILLTHVAIRQADTVSVVAFSDQVHAYVPPVRGPRALQLVNESLYTLEPRVVESDYDRACRFVAAQHRKRSLIVLFSDVLDLQASSSLVQHMVRFARHHLPLCVTMRPLDVEAIAARKVHHPQDCHDQAMAVQLLDRRATALTSMRRSGVNVLDVNPMHLTPRLLERYLQLKQRMRL